MRWRRRCSEWETIDAEQIEDIMSGKPPRPAQGLDPSGQPQQSSGGNPPPVSTDGSATATV